MKWSNKSETFLTNEYLTLGSAKLWKIDLSDDDDELYEEIKESLESNPYRYFVEEEELYTFEDLMEQFSISINYRGVAENLVSEQGAAEYVGQVVS